MDDLLVTVPKARWLNWLAEGDLPGDPPEESGLWHFGCNTIGGGAKVRPGARVYVCAWGRLRGYAPLLRVENFSLVRGGGAVACTLPRRLVGFQGHRLVSFRGEEQVFPDWATAGLPRPLARDVERLLELRAAGPGVRAELRRRAQGGLPLFTPALWSFG